MDSQIISHNSSRQELRSHMSSLVIAIDGPAGSGKSTTARAVADRLGWLYVDTGAMYRAFALKARRAGVALTDAQALVKLAGETDIALVQREEHIAVLLDGEDVSSQIRSEDVGKGASEVATVSGVRRRMVELQRKMGEKGRVVLEGRDTTTVVFPDAVLKVYVTASLGERAKRRKVQLDDMNEQNSLEDITEGMAERDRRDESREDSPLRIAEGAMIVDTSALTIDEQVEQVLREARRVGIVF